MEPLTWDSCKEAVTSLSEEAVEHLNVTAKYIQMYRGANDNGEQLSQILAELNFRVLNLGDLQAKLKRIELWTDGRYKIEKGLSALALLKEGKSGTYASEAKYESIQDYFNIMVDASAMHMRVQNGRSSARDTTEAIRSRISQIKGAIRSS